MKNLHEIVDYIENYGASSTSAVFTEYGECRAKAKAQLNHYVSNQVVEELKALEAIIATIDNDGANPSTVFSKVDRAIHTRLATLEATKADK